MIELSTQSSQDEIKDLVLAKLAEAGDEEPFDLRDGLDNLGSILREMLRLQRRFAVFEQYTPGVYRDASDFQRYSREYSDISRNFITSRNPDYLVGMNSRRDFMSRIRLRYEAGGEKSDSAILFQTALADVTSFNRIVANLA